MFFFFKKNGNLQTTRIDLPTQAAKSSGNYMRPFHSRTCWQWNDVKCESHELIGQPRKTFSPNNKRKLPTAGRKILLCIDQGDRDDMYDQGSHFSGLTKFPDFSSIFSIFPVFF